MIGDSGECGRGSDDRIKTVIRDLFFFIVFHPRHAGVLYVSGGGGCGSADDKGEQVAVKKQRMDYSAIARVGGSVAKYKADQESA